MLIQGPMALRLHIFHEVKYFRPVILKMHVDGTVETLRISNFHMVWKIWCLEDPLPVASRLWRPQWLQHFSRNWPQELLLAQNLIFSQL